MQVPFSPPDIREEDIEAVVKVLRSGWITSGPVGEEFRQALTDYCGSENTMLVNSATAALEISLRLLGIGPGDEVIVPAYTYSASAAVIQHVGAKIVMVDVSPGDYFVSPDTWAQAITERTKAIIPVDLAGVMVDTKPLYRVIEEARPKFHPTSALQEQLGRIALVIDGAHSLGATRNGLRSGAAGDFTAFSFHAVKNLTTAEGGALTWRKDLGLDSDWLARQTRLLILHGQSKSALEKSNAAAWEYDIAFPGFKMNMPDIMAALGLSQLRRYEQTIARRHEIIERYNQAFADLPVTPLAHIGVNWRSSGHLYLLGLEGHDETSRNQFIQDMYQRDVACNVHYKPLPMMTAYRDMGLDIDDFPHAFAQYEKQVTLPLHTCLSDAQVNHVIASVRGLLG